MKKSHDIDATPTKKSYLAIVSDYALNTAICELIDNSIDVWTTDHKHTLLIKILFGLNEQTIRIEDNAGGLPVDKLNLVVQPGASSNSGDDHSIGIFGVGSKRAVISLAKKISITTRVEGQPAYEVVYDHEWLEKDNSWDVPCYEAGEKCAEGHTIVKLNDIRHPFDQNDIDDLKLYLSTTYGRLLSDKIIIKVGSTSVESKTFDNWAFPNNSEPINFFGSIETPDNMIVNYSVTGGLLSRSEWATDDWGVFFYCNGRLIASGVKGAEVGFVTGQAGVPHYSHSVSRVIVDLKGPARWMPWNSNKTSINFTHEIFQFLKKPISDTMTRFARISKSYAQSWDAEIFSHNQGEIKRVEISDASNITTIPLPALPQSKPNYLKELKNLNDAILIADPWKEELIDGVRLIKSIEKQKSTFKNIFIVILLDSIINLALRRYAKHNARQQMVLEFSLEGALNNLRDDKIITKGTFNSLHEVLNMKSSIFQGDGNIEISNHCVNTSKQAVQAVLFKLFKIKFPADD